MLGAPRECDKLDAVLIPDPSSGRTRLAWLQREATTITPSAILFEIGKLTALRAIGAQVSCTRGARARRVSALDGALDK